VLGGVRKEEKLNGEGIEEYLILGFEKEVIDQ